MFIQGAVSALEGQDLDTAFNLFTYFIENFNDNEKKAISYFWLGEISIIKNNLDASNDFFMELILSYPSHYRVPLAHKKIGDIYMKKNEPIRAKEKYNFVVQRIPKRHCIIFGLAVIEKYGIITLFYYA